MEGTLAPYLRGARSVSTGRDSRKRHHTMISNDERVETEQSRQALFVEWTQTISRRPERR